MSARENATPLFVEALRVARFGLTGLVAALVYFCIATAGVRLLSISPVLSSLTGHVASVVTSYLGHKYFTFRVGGSHFIYATRFLLVAVPFGFGVNIVLTWILIELLQVRPELAFLIVMILIPPGTYVINRFFVFTTDRGGQDVV